MTIEEIKHAVAQEHGYDDWNWLMVAVSIGDKKALKTVFKAENQAMHRLAEIVAIQQRDYDADHADLHDDSNCYREGGYCTNTRVDHDAIRKHPLASDEYKP